VRSDYPVGHGSRGEAGGQSKLVNAVYERAVEVKEENWLDTHCLSPAENVSVAMEVHQSSHQPRPRRKSAADLCLGRAFMGGRIADRGTILTSYAEETS
jgi:hypothetical protein